MMQRLEQRSITAPYTNNPRKWNLLAFQTHLFCIIQTIKVFAIFTNKHYLVRPEKVSANMYRDMFVDFYQTGPSTPTVSKAFEHFPFMHNPLCRQNIQISQNNDSMVIFYY